MQVLFIHPAFPAQFGHIAHYLAAQRKWTCTFLTSIDATRFQALHLPFQILNYQVQPGSLSASFHGQATLQERIDHMKAIYQTLRAAPRIQPDLVVGHMTFGTMLFLRNLYRCPFFGYFEWMPPPYLSHDGLFRRDFPPPEDVALTAGVFHAFTYLHLHAVDAAYTPTRYQLSTAPKELQSKIRVIHDGVDLEFYQPRRIVRPTTFRGLTIDEHTRIVTYVSPGLESMRGFDIFMRTAKSILREVKNVLFLVAGDARTNYGFDEHYLPPRTTFKQWVLSQDDYDLSKFHFLGWIPPADLAMLFNLSDLHFYLTTPYVLSWSLVQAMASGCTILGSATVPVQEAVDDGVHGLLADFYDVDGLADRALRVLKDQAAFKPLGRAARRRAEERYDARICISELANCFQGYAGKRR